MNKSIVTTKVCVFNAYNYLANYKPQIIQRSCYTIY